MSPTLEKFSTIDSAQLARINGGSKKDYNFFYNVGKAVRKTAKDIINPNWWVPSAS